jgi:HPt (histidine-containing phosphotransfer) domain-containing protein
MDGYIPKPIDPKLFTQIIETGASPSSAMNAEEVAKRSDKGKGDGVANADKILARFDGNRKLLGSLVQTFQHDCPKMMTKIRGALSARDPRMLAESAHALKGSVGNFGPSSAFETAREIEKTGREGKLDGAWELYATLEDDLARFLPVLQSAGTPEGVKAQSRTKPSRAGRNNRLQHRSRRKR